MFLGTGLKIFPTFLFTSNCSASFAAATWVLFLDVMETVSSPQRQLTERFDNLCLHRHSAGFQLWSHFAKNLCSYSSHGLGELHHHVCAHCHWCHWKPCLPEAVYLLYPQRSKARQLSLHQLMGNAQLLHCGSNLSTSTFLDSRPWISEVFFKP